MDNKLVLEFEKAVRFLAKNMPISDENSRKPILSHDIRVGTYLYENGYDQDIVVAGLLHDVIEWSKGNEQMIRDEFGDKIAELVLANTKNDSIEDKNEKIEELIKRCSGVGNDALIIKTADIIDSFKWYTKKQNEGELEYCRKNAEEILKFKQKDFEDKIFDEIIKWK